jgi:hypothetical protein
MSQQPVFYEWNNLVTSLVVGIDTVVCPMLNLSLSQRTLYLEGYGYVHFVHILRAFELEVHRVRGMCIPIFNDQYHRAYGQYCRLNLSPMVCGRDFINTCRQDPNIGDPTLMTAVWTLRECLADPNIINTLENTQYLILVAGACLALTDGFRATRGIPKKTIDDDDDFVDDGWGEHFSRAIKRGRAMGRAFAAEAAWFREHHERRERQRERSERYEREERERRREREERERCREREEREREERERQERRPRPQEPRVQNVVNNHVVNNVNNHVVNNHNHVVNNNANNDVATLASVAVRGVILGLTGVMF